MHTAPTTFLDRDPPMWVPSMDAIVASWFTSYREARAALESRGGYLLPYRGQYFVIGPEGVRQLGLDPRDGDWDRIGFDWVRPADREAWQRLRLKRVIAW